MFGLGFNSDLEFFVGWMDVVCIREIGGGSNGLCIPLWG